jgi:YidC/Oxa1 family membrane protein insertase
MQDQKNTILAIVLSAIVLIGWQYFFATPQANRQRQLAEQQRQEQVEKQPAAPAGSAGSPTANAPQAPGQAGSATAPQPREKVLASTPRVEIDTPSVRGSIDLRGARLDDLSLVKYRETVDPNSPIVVLLAPSGTEDPFYAEFGWIAGAGTTAKLPNA